MGQLFMMIFMVLIILLIIVVITYAFLVDTFKSKGYSIFLDDIRTVEMVYAHTDQEFEVVRNVKDFKALIEKRGIPEYISFDHDLGLDESGNIAPSAYDAVKWMIFTKEYDLSDMDFYVHSDNPVGAKNIRSLIENWQKELKRRNG